MRPRQHSGANMDRTYRPRVTAVNSRLSAQNLVQNRAQAVHVAGKTHQVVTTLGLLR